MNPHAENCRANQGGPCNCPALVRELVKALRDLREAATDAYKAGRVAAEPFVRAGNVIAEAEGR